jgi:hypothetical protein
MAFEHVSALLAAERVEVVAQGCQLPAVQQTDVKGALNGSEPFH